MAGITGSEILQYVNESVDKAMKKNNIPDTPLQRVDMLSGMYKIISDEGIHEPSDRIILKVIEDEIIRLQEEL